MITPKLPTAKQRQYLYNLATGLAPILVVCGLASQGTVSIVVTALGAILGVTATGTASVALSRQRALVRKVRPAAPK
jgi:hypothetical protein